MSLQHNAFQHNAFQVQVPTAGTPQSIGSFASNGGAPQIADYGRIAGYGVVFIATLTAAFSAPRAMAFVSNAKAPQADPSQIAPQIWEPTPKAQGKTVASTSSFGLHAAHYAEYAATRSVWESQPAPAVVASAAFKLILSVDRTTDKSPSTVWPAQVSGKPPSVIPRIQAAPQQIDLTQQAYFVEPISSRQGTTVRPYTSAAQQSYTDAPSALWPSLRTPPVAAQAALPFISAGPQADQTQTPASIMPSKASGARPDVRLTFVVPQQGYADAPSTLWPSQRSPPATTQAILPILAVSEQTQTAPVGSVWASAVSGARPQQSEQIATLPQEYTDVAPKVWASRPAPAVIISSVPQMVSGAPQADPTQIQGQLFEIIPKAQGRTVASTSSFGQHALETAEYGATRLLWEPLVAGAKPPVLQTISIQQQAYVDSVATVWSAQPAPIAAILGPTVTAVPPVPPQFDPTLNFSQFWTASTFSPSAAIVAPVITEQPAGRRVRNRPVQYIVKIDSQEFVCRTVAEALDLLNRAKKAAELFSVQKAEEAATRFKSGAVQPKLPRLDPPVIKTNSRDLRAAVSSAKRDIAETYRKALRDSEIRMYFALEKKRAEQDEEDSILLLM
jgi:hypothetical protein